MAKYGIYVVIVALLALGLVTFLYYSPCGTTIEKFQADSTPGPPPSGLAPNVIYGPSVGRNIPIQRIEVDNAGNTVYIAYDGKGGGYTKMVNSKGVNKYYTGYVDQYISSNWDSYNNSFIPNAYLVGYISPPLPPPDAPPPGIAPYPSLPIATAKKTTAQGDIGPPTQANMSQFIEQALEQGAQMGIPKAQLMAQLQQTFIEQGVPASQIKAAINQALPAVAKTTGTTGASKSAGASSSFNMPNEYDGSDESNAPTLSQCQKYFACQCQSGLVPIPPSG